MTHSLMTNTSNGSPMMAGSTTLHTLSGEELVSHTNYLASCSIAMLLFFVSFVDMPLERKTPVVYPDGVYEIVREESRGNVLLISNLTQHGLSGLGSVRRTAFFTFFGMEKKCSVEWCIFVCVCV